VLEASQFHKIPTAPVRSNLFDTNLLVKLSFSNFFPKISNTLATKTRTAHSNHNCDQLKALFCTSNDGSSNRSSDNPLSSSVWFCIGRMSSKRQHLGDILRIRFLHAWSETNLMRAHQAVEFADQDCGVCGLPNRWATGVSNWCGCNLCIALRKAFVCYNPRMGSTQRQLGQHAPRDDAIC